MEHVQTKQQAMDLFETKRKEFLVYCRWVAKRIAEKRPAGEITIDDIREQVDLPYGVDGRVFGAVFNTSDWESIGYVKSKQGINHGRPISIFRLKSMRQEGSLF